MRPRLKLYAVSQYLPVEKIIKEFTFQRIKPAMRRKNVTIITGINSIPLQMNPRIGNAKNLLRMLGYLYVKVWVKNCLFFRHKLSLNELHGFVNNMGTNMFFGKDLAFNYNAHSNPLITTFLFMCCQERLDLCKIVI